MAWAGPGNGFLAPVLQPRTQAGIIRFTIAGQGLSVFAPDTAGDMAASSHEAAAACSGGIITLD